ncbi:MAG: hypothetical protein GY941_11465 [Planctomycetes bacterium]|nr:hypothetical protein [Planctomycetota bacterium]
MPNLEKIECAICSKSVEAIEATQIEEGYLEGHLAHPECAADYAEESANEAAHQTELRSNWNE